MRSLAPLVVLLVLGIALAEPRPAPAVEPLSGPNRVQLGQKVIYRASNLTPNASLFVYVGLTRARDGNCCSVSIEKPELLTDGAGRAAVRFRFPRRYKESYCPKPSECVWHRWKRGERADVNVCVLGEVQHCARKTVRIGRNRSAPKPLAIPATARKAIFRAVCPSGERCEAKVTIDAGKKTLARGGYSVPAGKSRKVHLGLTAAGRRKLSGSNRVKAKATIADTRTGKRKSFPVILRRRK